MELEKQQDCGPRWLTVPGSLQGRERGWDSVSFLLGLMVSFPFSSPEPGAQAAGRGQRRVCEVGSWGSNPRAGDEAVVVGV